MNMNMNSPQQPFMQSNNQTSFYSDGNMKYQTLKAIGPVIRHGLREAHYLGFPHALTEAVAIGYLMGKGESYENAWKTVESWWRPPGTPLPQMY